MPTVPVPVTTGAIAGSATVAIGTLASTFQELRMNLLRSLPTYMVPTLYIPMDDMPINASGKLDRLAIRAYLNTVSISDLQQFMPNAGPKEAPTTEMERRLQALWAETLQIDTEDIGCDDDFFQIGGDSVAAMRMVALQAARKLQLTVATIFQHSKLSDLALFLDEQSTEDQPEEPDPEPFTLWRELEHADSVTQAQRLEWIARRCDVSVEEIEDVYPCTPTQEGLIAITAHQHSAYVSRQVYRLSSSIRLDRFQAAWETLATVTPILRTRILVDQEANESRLVQVVIGRQLSWQHSSDLDKYVASDQNKEMQLGQPLVRLAIVQHPTERFLVWTAHHSVYDGWSAGLMYQHLADIYLHDRVPSAVPYTRFIRHLLRRDHAADIKYWCTQLQGDLIVSWPPLPREDYQPKPMHRDIYKMLLPPSKIHNRPASVLPAILRAAWALVMVKYAGQGHSVVFAMALAGRNLPVRQLTKLAAPTITTVPVRIDVDQKQCVRDFLQMIQQQATEMMAFENTGLQGIRKLAPELRPVLEVRNLLAIQPAWEAEDTVFPEMDALPVNLQGFDIYPLTVQCSLGLDAITVETRYDENVIAGAQVKRMVRCLEHVVKQLYSIHTDTYKVRDISLVSTADQATIIRWNGTAPARVEQCVHHLVADQINQRPDTTAICAWDGNLTYKELANYANQLAWYLEGLQVGAENMVGVCMDKSKWAGVAMLAILQAGGVVVPLGVAHPKARLTGILEDTRTKIVLVDAKQRGRLSTLPDVQLVVVDESLLQRFPAREDELHATVGPDNAAWVVYTSGSTGKPKGVVLQHRALCSSIQAHGARFGMNSQTRMLQFAAHTFDACIQDYFTTLSWGGVVCVPNEEERMSNLTTAMRRMEVVFATLTSTVARLIHPPDVPSMQKLALVGEPVKADVVKQWLPYVTVLNAYGPSECSIHSSCSEPLTDPKQASIIGTAMGTRLWVVDVAEYNQLCPIGAPGELLIEGPLLAREYLNDEVQTRAAFVIEPSFIQQLNIQSDHGYMRRMYRTGDMVRQNEDGSITHLGRRDTQVKIRGQRVEVGEIEYQITQQLQGARSVAVQLLQESATEQISLTAVVDFQEGCEHRDRPVMLHGMLQPTPALNSALRRLRGTLFQLLPTYMVPAVFLPILEMPLNVSGKLDRRAIGELLKAIGPEYRQKYLAAGELSGEPATPIQRKLQDLWAYVLHVPVSQINIYDNFFQIGGDSVVAMRLVATAAGRELRVTVADIFRQPQLVDLAEHLSTRLLPREELNNDSQPFSLWLGESPVTQQQHDQLQEIANQCGTVLENIQDVYPCTPLQQDLIATTAEQSSAYVNRLIFKLDPNLDLDRFQESWKALSATTPILRTRIVASSKPSKPLLQVVLDEEISWNFSTSLDEYLVSDQQDEMGPGTRLVRYGLVRGHNSEERFFVWTAHHSLYDGWSSGLLYKNFTEIFQSGYSQSTVPFTRFIRFLRNQEEDENKKMDRAEYWSNQLQGDVMNNWPSLPHVRYRPQPGLELTEVVSLAAHRSGSTVTASNVLRAAWALVMAQYSGHNDVVFAATVSGRNAPVLGIESMVGPTITTVPVRVHVDWNQDVTSFLNSVQEQAVQMIDYEHTGLRTIKALISSESRPALELRNILVVQTAEEGNANKQFPGVQQLVGGEVTQFDSHALTVDCTLSPLELRVAIRYDEHVMPTAQVQRILSHLTHLVRQLYNPALIKSRNLGELDLITAADKRLIFEHNALVDVSRVDQCIHTMVYKQVLARPNSPAVCAWDGNLTYCEMFSQAVQLAHFLVDAGVSSETKIGLCMDKSKWAIVAMLGTLFAGGVIVPLSITHPLSRLKVIIEDTAAKLILVDAKHQLRLGSLDLNMVLVAAVEFRKDGEQTAAEAKSLEPLVPTSSLRLAFATLRHELLEVLPTYMVPLFYVPVAHIPLNTSGKLDRRAVEVFLREIPSSSLAGYIADETELKTAPSTPMETFIQRIWAQALRVPIEEVGAHDHFFHLGGDSVTAMRIVIATNQESKELKMVVTDIFQNPRLSDLARVMEEKSVESEMVSALERDPAPFDLWEETVKPDVDNRTARLALIAEQCGVSVEQIEDVYPCTPLQEGLLASTARQPSTYVSRQMYALSDKIDIARFQAAWQTLASSMPILRTRAIIDVHKSWQVVVRGDITWNQHSSLKDYIAQDEEAGIQLGQPLARYGLIYPPSSDPVFVWTAHHSIYDGFSIRLLCQELIHIYNQADYIPRSIPFSRFIRYLTKIDTTDSLEYWDKQLEGDVMADWPPLPNAGYEPRARVSISKEVTSAPHMGQGILMANVLRAAWGLTMVQFSGHRDVVYAANVSGRNAPVREVSEIIAPTITTVPLRIQVNTDNPQSVGDFLRGVQDQAIKMINYEHTGLQGILSHPVLQLRNMLVIQTAADSDTTLDFPGIEALPLAVEDFDSYGVNVQCTLGQAIVVEARFDSNIVSATFMTRVLDQFTHILEQLCDPNLQSHPLLELDFLSSADQRQIAAWNSTVPRRVDKCVHELVREQAHACPTSQAIWAWDGNLSYGELIKVADLLAIELTALGVELEQMVGVSMSKSKWVAVALLATLQAGGVVVPLSVTHPTRRIETIVNDTKATVILVDAPEYRRLNGNVNCQLLVVDSQLLERLSITPATDLRSCPLVTSDHAAWVIYTSGTTGTPKGAVLEHGTLCTSIKCHGARYGFGTHTRKLQYAAHTFDGTIEDYFTTLAWGGLCCGRSERACDDIYCGWIVLARRGTHTACPRFGGEPATVEVTNLWRTKVDLFNCYGPSECSIFSSAAGPVQNVDEIHNIGQPIGTRLWVVDPQNYNFLCPVGAPGELLIEGPQLARGYLNNETKTNEHFILDPHFMSKLGLKTGRRVYRSGDIVRQKDDGSFVYVARRDTQVKIRGQRVEIGEIEYQIARHLPETRAVAVELLKRGGNSEPVLVGAIEFAPDSRYQTGDIQAPSLKLRILPPTVFMTEAFQKLYSALMQVLPTHMVPASYLPVAQMPRNLSGKLDRATLREQLALISAESMLQHLEEGEKIPPSTEMECKLHVLWLEALGIEQSDRVGVSDNFFQLGGDSVAAMRLAAMTWQRHNLQLSVADIFHHPHLCDLAQSMTERSFELVPEEEDPEPFTLWVNASPEAMHDIATRCYVDVSQIEDIYPCTPLQEGFMATTTRQSAAYISRQVYLLSAKEIDLDRFKSAWETLSSTTPILRTRVMMGPNKEAIQVVVQSPIVWRCNGDLTSYIAEDCEKGMMLDQPLVRYGLVTESADKSYFIWTAHHSVYDGWTMREIVQRFAEIYNSNNHTSAYSIIPYSRFIRYLMRQDPVETTNYWQNELTGEVVADWPPLPQIGYHPRPQSRIRKAIVVPKGSNEGVLVSTTLRAAWAVVMVQYSGSNDIAFAASVSGRHAAVRQIKEIAGPTLATVPVRVSIDKSMTVIQLLRKIQQQSTEMIPYEQTGLQKIKELLPEMSGSALALRNLLVIQPAAETDNNSIALSGLESLPVPFEDFGSFGLQVECTLGSNEIEVDVQYDEHVIASPNVLKVVDYFVHIVKELSNPNRFEQPLHMLHVSPQDEDQILAWNRVGPTGSDQCIHDLVFDRVLRQPTASAICAWDGDFTYAELSCHAARLADHLILEIGVKQEKTVGLCMDKSKWAAVAMLAILYAGGVAVPLGVTHPLTRVQVITQDAAVDTVLVDSEQHQRLAPLGLRLFSVDVESIEKLTPLNLAQTTAPIRETEVAPHNTAWIIYTSGSTGTPKGVILEHRALSTSIMAHGAEFKMDHTTRTLQFAAHTFDAIIQDLFTTLWVGGCVCIPSEHDRVNRLTTSMISMSVNFATLTSTVASMLVPQQIPSIRTMILVGEPVTAAVVALWSPHATVLNAYGPSECSIHSSCSRPIHDTALASNIGFPLACSWWVVQAENHHALCPIGAPGELMIEGPIQARGYLNDEEKTRAAFVTDPDFMQQLGLSDRRLYRTGDLVKQNPDGSLTHLGRRDFQVKIRGQRIEVGEIEYQIQQHLEGARTVAVERIQHGADGKQVSLVAVLDMMSESNETASRDGPQPLAPSDHLRAIFNNLRHTLFRVLPGYMVPAAYLPVDHMPSNPNNKLDRRAIRDLLAQHSLPRLQQYIQHEGGEIKALPMTGLEEQVHALWLEVFDISADAVGMNDNFFHLGGDSVTAMRLVVVAASQGLQLSVEDIFKWPQLLDLTSHLAKRPSEDVSAHETKDPAPFSMWKDFCNCSTDEREDLLSSVAMSIGVKKDQIEDIYPCTPLQEGLMAVTARQPAAYVSRQVYLMGNSTNREQFKAAWETLSAEVNILRSRIVMEVSAVQVVVCGTIFWQYGTDLQQYLQIDRDKGMSLGQPLVRYGFVEEPSGECYFIWTAHHALYDGWTVNTLSKRLGEIYHSNQSRSSVPFTRFIQYLENGRPDTVSSTDYWRNQLEGDVMASWPRRPTDIQPLPQEDLQRIISLPATQRQCKVTMSTILRAAWSLVVAQYSGHDDIAFAATLSGRNARVRGISDIAGPTITTVPIRVNVEKTQTVARYLEAIQLQATNMIYHEHTGLQSIKALVPELSPTLDMGSLLVIQPADESGSDEQLAFPGMESIPMPIEPFNAHAITLECKLGQQQVIVDVHYDKNIIPSSQMKHVMDYFSSMIHRLCETVAQSESLAGILTVDQASQEQILQWNTEVPVRLEKCIHEMVQEQVDRSPSATAINAWDGDFTYSEFSSAAARLAHHLVSLHVGPEIIVGFCMEKSKWGSVAMLAIMQAGGVNMPLGITQPLARIKTIIEASQTRVIVVSPEQGERLRGLSSINQGQRITLVAVVEFATDSAHRPVPTTPSGILPLSTELQTAFATLYQILLRTLPLYMVPPVFLPIAEMSRNLSGKLDRKSLRALLVNIEDDNIHEYRVSVGTKVAPSTNMERDLQALWAKGLNLKLENIGANDNFFHIGGDSLAAMRIVAASHSRSYTLTVADIFKYSCLSDLALILSARAENETPVVSGDELAPFSLIGSDNPEEFIQNVLYPVCDCSTRDVIDILPTTDFQAMTVAGILAGPRAGNCAHFLLDGNSTYDIERLRKSCLDLIKTIPVLRTAYVFDQGRLLQVIKSVHEPEIRIFRTDRSIEVMTSEIINQLLLPPPRLGEPFTQIAIIEESRSSRHRVLLRMTHAEYDAVSMNTVWEILKCIIEGTVPHPQPLFSAFLYHQQQSIAPNTYRYWTNLLSGSSMTNLGSSHTTIGQYPSQVAHLAPQTIRCVNPQSEGITIAILVKAAWAVTISRFSNTQDVVFGDTVSTRGTVKASLMNAMGCCVTLLPVRLQLSNEATVRELLHKTRDQQIQSLDHGQLGFREILHGCTDWVTSTRFTSTFNSISEQTRTLDLGSKEYAISTLETPDATWTVDVGVTAVSRDGELDLRISYRPGSISKETALEYLRILGNTVRTFLSDSSQTLKETMSPFETPIISRMTKPISEEDGMTFSKLKQTPEWEAVLQHRRGVEGGKTRMLSFAQRGGDLLDAVYLSSLLGDGDQSISALDILTESQEDGDRLVDAPPSEQNRRASSKWCDPV
ncbi:hypothetical protein N7537_003212 [Penicillium hordei]|uniref:Carrier domain-containing protein n=1 Tax=Penicillium hordei TaxID=40994 RepID=A0AAD6MPF2_9EURO|nr:uncharacterized protein N7537_003212 [Penicillium hordei]KAJ5618098.1 hypothetical protein N7537_003212 [Penicillium hordei]